MIYRLVFLILLTALPGSASALETTWVKSEYVSMRLLTATEAFPRDGKIEAGVELNITPDWYTYWRMPGDSGLAPQFDWSESSNVKDILVDYPAPKRFESFGLHSFGYEGSVLFPVTITAEKPDEEVLLSLHLEVVVCHEICVPQTMAAEMRIPPGKVIKGEHAYKLEQARKNLPATEDTTELKLEAAVLSKNAVVVTAWAKEGFDSPDMFIEAPGDILTLPPFIIVDEKDVQRGVFKIIAPEGVDLTEELFGQSVTVTFVNRGTAVEKIFNF